MVIGLPANIFFGTEIPTCILVLQKERINKDNILFLDASQHFEKGVNSNVMQEEDLIRILDAVVKRENIEKFAFVATQSILEENDYNLNIARYVDTFEEDDPINLDSISKLLISNDSAMANTDIAISSYCAELGIKAPFKETK